MVTIKTEEIENMHYVCITVRLPKLIIRCIMTTKAILCNPILNLEWLNQYTNAKVLISSYSDFIDMLYQPIIGCTDNCKLDGVEPFMIGKDALHHLTYEK